MLILNIPLWLPLNTFGVFYIYSKALYGLFQEGSHYVAQAGHSQTQNFLASAA